MAYARVITFLAYAQSSLAIAEPYGYRFLATLTLAQQMRMQASSNQDAIPEMPGVLPPMSSPVGWRLISPSKNIQNFIAETWRIAMSNWQAALLFGIVYFAFVAGVIVGKYVGSSSGYTTTAQDD